MNKYDFEESKDKANAMPDWTDGIPLFLLIVAAAILTAFAFAGCSSRVPLRAAVSIAQDFPAGLPVSARVAAGETKGEKAADSALALVRTEARELRAQLAAKDSEAASLEGEVSRAHTAANVAAVRTTSRWLTIISIIAAAALGVLAWLVPIGRKSFITAATACVGVCVLAQTLAAAAPWLPWIGAGVFLVSILLILVCHYRLFNAGKQLGNDLHEYAKALPDEARTVLANASVAAQEKSGLLNIVDQLLPVVTRKFIEQVPSIFTTSSGMPP